MLRIANCLPFVSIPIYCQHQKTVNYGDTNSNEINNATKQLIQMAITVRATVSHNAVAKGGMKSPTYTIKFISIDEVTTSVAPSQTPSGRLGGLHQHDARKWREFFMQYEPFYNQCTGAAHRLVAALNDIRHADLQGLPTRRQLYAQHRALSRALMDSELHNLRKRSTATMLRLQELAKNINHSASSYAGSLKSTKNVCGGIYNRNKFMSSGSSSYSFNYQSNQNHSQISHNISTIATLTKSSAAATSTYTPSTTMSTKQAKTTSANISNIGNISNISNTTNPIIKSSIYSANLQTASTTLASRVCANYTSNSNSSSNTNNTNNNNNNMPAISTNIGNVDVAIRLQKVTLLFNEIDRAAKRLEQLTEQRREHLRELTRQRALEDEINE
ncbi:hypothetical protein DOY81_009424, partial [Sarcophaga bullata]